MRGLPIVVGVVLLVAGLALVATSDVKNARTSAFDPTADAATGSVHIVSRGDPALRLPAEMHRGASYVVYERTFLARTIPENVSHVEFGVHFSLAPVGSVPYPWAPRFLPAQEAYSGRHLQGSPWVRPYGEGVHVVEDTHVFREQGDVWRARLVLDTAALPANATTFDYVVGSWYVATLEDGSTWDLQGIAGAGEEHTIEVRDGGFGAIALQKAGIWVGVPVAIVGFAVAGLGLLRLDLGAWRKGKRRR